MKIQGEMSPFHMSTWNVEGKGSPENIDKILSSTEFKRKETAEEKNPHIVCIQQANLPSGGESENYRWLCSGEFGSAVLISKDSYFKSWSFKQVCEQICVAEVAIDDQTVLIIISCCIPPPTEYVTGDLWPKLLNAVKTIPSNVTYFLAGDFNAEIGREDICPDGVDRGMIGKKLHHKNSNQNGVCLKKLIVNCHAKIINTFGGPRSPDYTYQNGGEQSQRSYIIVPFDRVPIKTSLQECQLIWHPDYNHAILSKFLKPTFYEKFSQLITSEVVVSSWNIQGGSTFAVDKALNELDVPIVCVQNLFLTSDNDVETENFKWFTSKKLWAKNVGILIKNSTNISLTDFEVVSEYLCAGNVNVKGHIIKVICCCLPAYTESAMFQKVGEQLTDLVKSIAKETPYVVAGDFNTHVTFTVIDETLVFDEGDGNALFLQKLVQEFMEITYMNKTSVTMASEKGRRNSSHILISSSCLMKYSHSRFVHWIPYYESGVVTLYLTESNQEGQNAFLVKGKVRGMVVEHKDGLIYVTKKICKLNRIYSVETNGEQPFDYHLSPEFMKKNVEQKSDLPEEMIAKYKNSPPPIEELLRILGEEFTIYYGFLQESALPKGCTGVLAASFDFLKRGDLLVECLEILEEKTETPSGRLVRFRWNGIVVHQQEGGTAISFNRIITKGQSVLIFNLGQHCFTVKAKRSFYSNGLLPLCRDKEKLKEVFRVVKRSEFSPTATVEDVEKFIDDFFRDDSYLELVFGSDFSHEKFLEPIKRYASNKNLGVRWFKSTNNYQYWDNLAVFIEHSPYEIRKRLMEQHGHQDLKFHLLPPCGLENNYFDWSNRWGEKIEPDANHWEMNIIPEKFYHCQGVKTETPVSNSEITEKNEDSKIKAEDITLASQLSQTELGETNKEQGVKRKIVFVHEEVKKVGEFTYKIKKCGNLYTQNLTLPLGKRSKDWRTEAREQSDLPMEIVEKYQETCVPAEELYSILGDEFTLYHGFVRESSVITGTMEILADSFESLNRGGLINENIDVFKGHFPCKRMVKFKWNGIVIHEEEGSTQVSFKNTNEVGRLALMDKLARHFCTVRAKKSFYNKGLPPKSTDMSKLNEVMRVMDGGDFPFKASSEEGKTFIEEFFLENPHLELVFGPDITHRSFFESIKKYASKKDLGFRYFKSKLEAKHFDNLVLFIKRTPLEVRESLKKLPDQQDLKFYLIPPCVGKIDHQDWSKQWVKDHVPEELVYFQNKDVGISNPVTPQIVPNQKKEIKRKLGNSPPVSNPFMKQASSSYCERYRPETKRVKVEVYERPRWEEVAPLIILWPITIRSGNENNPRKVLEANFPTEVVMEPNNGVAVFVTLPLRNWGSKRFCLCIANDLYNATSQALDMIVRHSSVIKHKPQYLPSGGRVPDFIQYNIPCQANPRTYIFLSKHETGPLTRGNITAVFYNFKSSSNEDVFFDRDSYTHEEKQLLLDLAPQHDLKVRHFGHDHRLMNRYVCVYKTKPKDVILDELLRMRDCHPKYMLESQSVSSGLSTGLFDMR